jgi:hypothetical protein
MKILNAFFVVIVHAVYPAFLILFCLIILTILLIRSLDSTVGTATGYGLGDRGLGVRIPVDSRIFSSPNRPDLLWGSPNLLSSGYRRLSSGGKAAGA